MVLEDQVVVPPALDAEAAGRARPGIRGAAPLLLTEGGSEVQERVAHRNLLLARGALDGRGRGLEPGLLLGSLALDLLELAQELSRVVLVVVVRGRGRVVVATVIVGAFRWRVGAVRAIAEVSPGGRGSAGALTRKRRAKRGVPRPMLDSLDRLALSLVLLRLANFVPVVVVIVVVVPIERDGLLEHLPSLAALLVIVLAPFDRPHLLTRQDQRRERRQALRLALLVERRPLSDEQLRPQVDPGEVARGRLTGLAELELGMGGEILVGELAGTAFDLSALSRIWLGSARRGSAVSVTGLASRGQRGKEGGATRTPCRSLRSSAQGRRSRDVSYHSNW